MSSGLWWKNETTHVSSRNEIWICLSDKVRSSVAIPSKQVSWGKSDKGASWVRARHVLVESMACWRNCISQLPCELLSVSRMSWRSWLGIGRSGLLCLDYHCVVTADQWQKTDGRMEEMTERARPTHSFKCMFWGMSLSRSECLAMSPCVIVFHLITNPLFLVPGTH